MQDKPSGETGSEINRAEDASPAPLNGDAAASAPQFMEIDTGRRRRWLGLVAYLLFFALVAGLLVLVFVKFTASLGVAVLLVAFMVAYMAIMGHIAGRNVEGKDGWGRDR